MAWQHIHLVRELDLPHVEKLVLFALASRVDESGECWPSVATLRKDTGLAQHSHPIGLSPLSLLSAGQHMQQPSRHGQISAATKRRLQQPNPLH